MNFTITKELEAELDELTAHYPQKRSASLMFLHAIQERFGCIPPEAIEWTARKLDLEPINIYELVTFYPMFRQEKEKVGRFQIKICRTLSCALGSCGTAPVVMVNEDFYEGVSAKMADDILANCQ